jgi:hypothetical protein
MPFHLRHGERAVRPGKGHDHETGLMIFMSRAGSV